METLFICIALMLVGLVMGSFAGASVWRLRSRELAADKLSGDNYDKAEYKKLSKLNNHSFKSDRSICLNCSYQLKWYDMLPLVSWLSLKGKCRNCRKSIGHFEPVMELTVATLFVVSYVFWPYDLTTGLEIARFVVWLVSGVGLVILFAYDAKWFLLPDVVNYFVVFIAVVSAFLAFVTSGYSIGSLESIAGSIAILSGLYFILYLVSKGEWIGFGDIKLGLGLGLLLADWRLAFITLFLANLIGSMIVVPLVAFKKLNRKAHVPFGPLLIVGAIISQLAGPAIIDWYMTFLI
jgi:prepilin signal peptidase PulO-like enzyme (type II secretory pathway)